MNVKKAFDHVSQAKLAQIIIHLGIDDDLIWWTILFLSNK